MTNDLHIRPCYVSLKNNVSTIEMELRTNKWQPGTEEFVSHNILAEYIQDTARQTDIESQIKFGTRVDAVDKVGSHWTIRSSKLAHVEGSSHPVVSTEVLADECENVCEALTDFESRASMLL